MFGTEALRLLRESWSSPDELAEEIYAILSSQNLPLEHQGPLTLTKPEGTQPPLALRGFSSGDTILTIRRPDGGRTDIKLGDFAFDGSTDLGGLQAVDSGSGGNQQRPDPQQKKGSGNVFTGTVQSGTGATYTVQPRDGGDPVTVTQLQIASDETIPVGTSVVVVQEGDEYLMQVPVWL